MRSWTIVGLAFLVGIGAVAQDVTPPRSTHVVDPAPNPNGWNNTPVEITITAQDTGSGVAAIHYVLNGDGAVVNADTAVIRIGEEGIHELEYWAVDVAGNEELPHHVIQIKIDLTPPIVFIETPSEGAEYFLHQPVEARWFAFDALSGIEAAQATNLFGEDILTEDAGFHMFVVRAADRAGNESVIEVNYQVVYKVVPAGAQGTYLDNPLPPEERRPLGKLPLSARYRQGESIEISFVLKDYYDEVYPDGVPSLTVTQVGFEGERERHTIWDWLAIPFDPEKGLYRILYPTAERAPGVYDLWIGFGDGNHVRLRIEILPRRSGG